jgi:uncharacterized protein YuzE
MEENTQDSKITENPTDAPAGFKDGEVLDTLEGKERVVYDRDEDGKVIGWHKEAVNG